MIFEILRSWMFDLLKIAFRIHQQKDYPSFIISKYFKYSSAGEVLLKTPHQKRSQISLSFTSALHLPPPHSTPIDPLHFQLQFFPMHCTAKQSKGMQFADGMKIAKVSAVCQPARLQRCSFYLPCLAAIISKLQPNF